MGIESRDVYVFGVNVENNSKQQRRQEHRRLWLYVWSPTRPFLRRSSEHVNATTRGIRRGYKQGLEPGLEQTVATVRPGGGPGGGGQLDLAEQLSKAWFAALARRVCDGFQAGYERGAGVK